MSSLSPSINNNKSHFVRHSIECRFGFRSAQRLRGFLRSGVYKPELIEALSLSEEFERLIRPSPLVASLRHADNRPWRLFTSSLLKVPDLLFDRTPRTAVPMLDVRIDYWLPLHLPESRHHDVSGFQPVKLQHAFKQTDRSLSDHSLPVRSLCALNQRSEWYRKPLSQQKFSKPS